MAEEIGASVFAISALQPQGTFEMYYFISLFP